MSASPPQDSGSRPAAGTLTSPSPARSPPRRRAVLALASTLLMSAGVFSGCQSFDDKQREWIFNPRKESWAGGRSTSSEMSDVWIDFQSKVTKRPARLHALWDANRDSSAPVMLYLHGARWDVTGSASRVRRMRDLGFSVLIIDYRGFGESSDELPSEQMAYEDARAAWDWLAARYPRSRRFVFGHSLGAAVAVELATHVDDAQGLIVEGAFPSISAVYQTMKWGWLPITWLITQRFDSASRIAEVKVPLLVVHGSADQLIPPELGRALFERAAAPKRFVLVDGGSHHNTNAIGEQQYREALVQMFDVPASVAGRHRQTDTTLGSVNAR